MRYSNRGPGILVLLFALQFPVVRLLTGLLVLVALTGIWLRDKAA